MQSIRDKLAGKKSKLAIPREKIEDHPADLNDYQDGSFYLVDIEEIVPDPNQPRKFFDPEALKELASSIKQKGVLQPVIIRKDPANRIYLVAGERRFRAAKMAGLTRIPAILTKGNTMEIALIENLQREDLKPIEEAEALARMVERHGYTHDQLSLVIGKARSTITETLSLNRLPDEIREECRRADIYPRRLLVEVAKKGSPKEMRAVFEQVKNNGLKSADVREIVRTGAKSRNRTPATLALEKIHTLSKHLNKFNLETAEPSQKVLLRENLNKLRGLIDKILN